MSDSEGSMEGISEDIVMHVINKTFQGYSEYKYIKGQNPVLKFGEGFTLAQYYGYDVKGISGLFYSAGNNTLKFYDSDHKLIHIASISNNTFRLDVPGALGIVVTGDLGLFCVRPEFNEIMETKRH